MAAAMLYAVKDKRLVHVDDVHRGLAGGCHCVTCGEPVLARQGDVRAHGFAHLGETSCHWSSESLAHRLTKQLIAESGFIWIPELDQMRNGVYTRLVHPKRVSVVDVQVEPRWAGVRPDLMVTVEGASGIRKQLAIEVYVTHETTAEKRRLYRTHRQPAIEIFVFRDGLDQLIEVLQSRMDTHNFAYWIWHPAMIDSESDNREQRIAPEPRRAQMHGCQTAGRPPAPDVATTHEPATRQSVNRPLSGPSRLDRFVTDFVERHGRTPLVGEIPSYLLAPYTRRRSGRAHRLQPPRPLSQED